MTKIQRIILDHYKSFCSSEMAEKIISNEINEGSEVKISANDIGLSIQAA